PLAAAAALFVFRPRLEHTRLHPVATPMAYGFTLVSMGLIALSLLDDWLLPKVRFETVAPLVGITAVAVGVIALVLRERRAPLEVSLVCLAGALGLAAICRQPGMIAAVCLLAVAFARRDGKLVALAGVFTLGFG